MHESYDGELETAKIEFALEFQRGNGSEASDDG